MSKLDLGDMLDAGWEWKPVFKREGGHTSVFSWKGRVSFWLLGLEEHAENYAWHDVGLAVANAGKPSPAQEFVRRHMKKRHVKG